MIQFQCDRSVIDNKLIQQAKDALELLKSRNGKGNDYLGWLDLPYQSKDDMGRIQKVADKIRTSGSLLVCIGIGGSYLGAKAVISSLFGGAHSLRFAGQHLSSLEMKDLLKELKENDFYVLAISKSGTTTEPGISFRLIRDLAESKYGAKAFERICVVTDPEKGALKILAEQKGYMRFEIPQNVGGRFSVLSPVGLLPIAAAGISLDEVMSSAKAAMARYTEISTDNMALQYAAYRMHHYFQGKAIELFSTFEPRIHFVAEWWKQLFGESEGKDGKGLFPASADFTTDLHSMGQWIQDAPRNIIETFCIIDEDPNRICIPTYEDDLDGLNYLTGKTLQEINMKAYEGTRLAHEDGGVPTAEIKLDKLDITHLVDLFVMYQISVSVSAYMSGVNPFDQPGVEAYKTNMFRLLGKPGF